MSALDLPGPTGPLFRRRARAVPALDMTPLVDVVFQLLIFFMLSSSFVNPSLPLALPGAAEKPVRQSTPIVVSLAADGRLFVNREAVEPEELGGALRGLLEGQENKAVNFRGDRSIEFHRFVDVMDRARRAGAKQLNIEYQPGPGE